ncbi:MAG TPA: hypothetical protein VK730_02675 [Solirubrobacteraceae bacterium]|nr:hypothetical protein [Solirubrobacteraceae bacterium]
MTPGSRRVLAAAAVALAACLACALSVVSTAAAAECSNEPIRVQQASTSLTDCRAYELVAPTGNISAEPQVAPVGLVEPPLSSPNGMHASISGERMAWTSEYPSPQSTGLNYLSTRGANGWTSEDVIPPQSIENGLNCPGLEAMVAYSSELTRGVLADGLGQVGSYAPDESFACGHDEPLLVSGEPVGFQNLFLRDNEHASYQLVNVTPPSAPAPRPAPENQGQYFPASFQAGSSDLSRVVFEEELPLAEGAGSGNELYDYFAGVVHLVTFLPGGTPVHGVLAGSTPNTEVVEASKEFVSRNIANYRHAMSADGSRVFFEADGDLYARTNPEQPAVEECGAGKACSVQVDEAQGAAAGPSGAGKFMVASEDGSRVFFTDVNRLTSDSNAEAGKPDLYEYDFERPTGSRLVDLTTGPGGPGEVLGVSGASGSGEDVYFVAEGALTGAQENTQKAIAESGHPNLYLFHGGVVTFIATLDATNDSCDWASQACIDQPLLGGLTARTSGNGEFIAFDSDQSLTGYANEGPACVPIGKGDSTVEGYSPGRCEEIYLYSESTNKLECVSCDPSGAPPAGPAIIHFPSYGSQDNEMKNDYPQRYVSESGQVFFESKDPLVAAATNGKLNVYEYANGKAFLISSGTSDANSYFLDASPDGSNIFFATHQALVQSDEGAAYAMYDARVGGGFRAQSEVVAPPPCLSLEGCHSSLSEPPAEFAVASATLMGPGNLAAPAPTKPVTKPKAKPTQCKKGRVKKHGRCVEKAKAKAKKSAKGRK